MVKARKGSIGLTSHLVRVGDQLGLFPQLKSSPDCEMYEFILTIVWRVIYSWNDKEDF